jgi:NAD(P)-dependent dehydrogenase (short-subunit alcohol dehydrogenase family)
MGHLIVIGGTRGIGLTFTRLVSPQYKRVTVLARSQPADPISGKDNVKFVSTNVQNLAALRRSLHRAVKAGGPVSSVALFQRHRGKEASWEGNLKVSLTATRAVVDCLQDKFARRGEKSIVMISSIASRFIADEQDEGYHVAKIGLIALMRFYAFKLGPLGIRVNAVSPGTLLKDESRDFFVKNAKLHELYRQITPLRRMGTAGDVAQVVRFLLSDQASFITGQEIIVDGGVGLQWQESLARRLKHL